MSQYISFASSGSPTNLNTTYETIGVTSGGAGTTLTGGAANTKGSYTEISAATSSAWKGFWVSISSSNSAGNRFLVDIATGAAASETIIISNMYCQPGTTGFGVQALWMPMSLAAGVRVSARCQSNGASGTVQVSLIGEVSTSNSRPMFASSELLVAADTTNTRASAVSITSVGTAGTGWTQVVASTAREYGAFVPNIGVTGTVPTVAQSLSYRLATGAAASEVLFWSGSAATGAGTPYTGRMPGFVIYRTTAASTRVAAEVLVGSAGDTFAPQVYGFY